MMAIDGRIVGLLRKGGVCSVRLSNNLTMRRRIGTAVGSVWSRWV